MPMSNNLPFGWQSHGNIMAASGDESGRQSPSSEKNGRASPTVHNPYYTGRPRTPVSGAHKNASLDRQEIIRKIKSKDGQSRQASPELGRSGSRLGQRRTRSPETSGDQGADLRPTSRGSLNEQYAAGVEIERPRSALHRGDFREKEHDRKALGRFASGGDDQQGNMLSTSPVAPWHSAFPQAAFRQAWNERPMPPTPSSFQQYYQQQQQQQRPARTRAVSNASLSNSFSYQAPTSPLVNAIRLDTPEPDLRQKSRSPDKSRRHTYSPPALKHSRTSLEYPASARTMGGLPPPSLRKEKSLPYQAHQPRRSINSIPSLPHSPSASSRRPSLSDGPRMVGSYEESILRGRMSTTPSKPLQFVAQIGVLGKGDCKSTLKCPPHVTVSFPAVFFSYGSPDEGPTAGQLSPYVGNVDLENNLDNQEPSSEKRAKRIEAIRATSPTDSRSTSRMRSQSQTRESKAEARLRRKTKQKRRSNSPKAPTGGSYRIPQCGQLQMIIKNPNKTAVKLFLVPYDLTDMEPGQKTFIRQRSYSAGPIIDMPLATRKNLGTDRPEAAIGAGGEEDPRDRPMLRYLVHLHICCPSKGRFYLYKTIRVVFANRVPDGKESLRNEIQLPEPRFSTYKASRESNVGVGGAMASVFRGNGAGVTSTPPLSPLASLHSHQVNRRLSYLESSADPFHYTPNVATEVWSQQDPGEPHTRSVPTVPPAAAYSLPAGYGRGGCGFPPTQALHHPFRFLGLETLESRPASRGVLSSAEGEGSERSREDLVEPPRVEQGREQQDGLWEDDPFVFEGEKMDAEYGDGAGSDGPRSRRAGLLGPGLRDLAFRAQARRSGARE